MMNKVVSNHNPILIVGPAWVGDMVMAQTLFKCLKQVYPNSVIDVIAPPWTVPLVTRMPEIRTGLPLAIGHGQLQLGQRFQIAKQCRPQNYQWAIVLPNSFKSALLPLWAKIPKRTGWVGEWRYGLLNDHRRLDKAALPLMIQRFAALAYDHHEQLPSKLPWPRFVIKEQQVQQLLKKLQLTVERPILAFCPGAEFGPAKRWPEKHFASVANYYQQQGWQIWIFGSKKDSTIATNINKQCQQPCVDLTGKTSLPEAIDLLSCAKRVITNDTGLMHIAAALQRPLVAIYGSSSANFTPPLSNQVNILSLNLACSPCFQRQCPLQHLDCLEKLVPQQVIDACEQLEEISAESS